MAREGFTGYMMQLVETADDVCMFCMSSQPHGIPLEKYEEVLDIMLVSSTEKKSDWRYWYELNDRGGEFDKS